MSIVFNKFFIPLSGLNTLEVGRIFVILMERLGFEKFYVQGGDWGSQIVSNIATVFPDKYDNFFMNVNLYEY